MAIVQISCLGSAGRFGNQLFQYSTAHFYAKRHNAVLQTPKWIGQEIFDINDPPLDNKLPQPGHDIIPNNQVNIDLCGYFQNKNSTSLLSLSQLKSLFRIKDKWLKMFPKTGNYAAAHMRKGDYLGYSNVYCNISKESYVRACKEHNISLELKWISEETQQNNPDLPNNLQFLPDFITLMNADVLLRANSTFSWWAGTLGNSRIYSPVVEFKTGKQHVDFVPGNHPRMYCGYSDIFLQE